MLEKRDQRVQWASEINWNEMAWIIAVVLINIFICITVFMADWDETVFVFTFLSFNCLAFLIELIAQYLI